MMTVCVCGQIYQKEEAGEVTEETPFVLNAWMSYYPFLLFTRGDSLVVNYDPASPAQL